MGRVIRRTVTITITETLTIIWVPEDEPLCQMTTDLQVQPKTTEEQNETIEVALDNSYLDHPNASETEQ
jgi:hypothetical protein